MKNQSRYTYCSQADPLGRLAFVKVPATNGSGYLRMRGSA